MTEIIANQIDSYVFRWEKAKPKYLLLKRRKKKFYGHLWQGVAGRIEEGESAKETVYRELKEETGLTPVRLFVVDHLSSFYQSFKDRINLIPVFGIEVESDEVILSDEHLEYRWVNLEEALSLLSWEQQRKALSVLHRMITDEDERLKWSEVVFD
ncbi:MAG: NUDIX pyrophosphatase [Candidatus Marinimicrobia bacterium]|nr:NUDIX pyrophosphatase [Candidatus Neomarinimicrobiota bacterium]